MRSIFLLLLLLLVGRGIAQNPQLTHIPTTYAIVLGISDYLNPDIPDIPFADKDALAMYQYLRSPQGGQLDTNNIQLLINEQATAAHLAGALRWAIDNCQQEDRLFFYYNGHCINLNKKTFFLCFDSPSPDFLLGGGALSTDYFNRAVETLSLQKQVKTLFIFDIGHPGKITGNPINDKAVYRDLYPRIANEIKLFSAEPDVQNRSGTQWGGGHSIFTYFLIKGVAGEADYDKDNSITLYELRHYLEISLDGALGSERQDLLINGYESEVLCRVVPGANPEAFFKTDDRQGTVPNLPNSNDHSIDMEGDAPLLQRLYPTVCNNQALLVHSDSLFLQLEPGNAIDLIRIYPQQSAESASTRALETRSATPQKYSYNVPLRPGLNTIRVVATKNVTTIVDTIQVYADFSPKLRFGLDDQLRYYALFIGNDHYQDAGFVPLNNPRFDCRTLAQELSSNYGFEVDTLFDADRASIFNKLAAYSQRFQDPNYQKRNDHLLVFYGGHGVMDQSSGMGYMVATDSKKDDPGFSSYVSYIELQTRLDLLKVKHILVVIDACQSGSRCRFWEAVASRGVEPAAQANAQVSSQFVQEKMRFTTRRFLTSAQENAVPDGAKGQHSPYAKQFLEALKQPDNGVLTLEQLQTYLDKSSAKTLSGTFGNRNEPGSNFLMLKTGFNSCVL
ncbi:MAG: caspase family protein [Lewinellaceae bacterium]|nr:caspase family protein [Lewinellaceae bacterium]